MATPQQKRRMSEREPRAIRIVEDRWATFRHIIEAVAIVAAGTWAFYTFIYQEKIKPAAEPAALDDSIVVHRLGRDRTRDILGVTVQLHNVGKTEIDIAADAYNVWGDSYGRREVPYAKGSSSVRADGTQIPRRSRLLVMAFAELRDAAEGGRKNQHIILEPGATENIDDVVVVPRGKYDLIHAQVIAVPVKTPVERKVPVSIERNKNGGFWLTSTQDGVFEDDNDADFALVP